MKQHIRYAFLLELERQCKFVDIAWGDLTASLQYHDEQTRVWFSIHALLTAAGNISKILWPSDTNASQRGQQLRAKLGISDESILKNRKLRNNFEHFDKDLEKYAGQSKGFADSNIGNIGKMLAGQQSCVYLRN